MVDLRSIGAGAAVTLGLNAIAVPAVGLVAAVPMMVASGVLGGAVAGWLGSGATNEDNKLQQGGFHGLQASGLGGAIVFGALFAFGLPATVESGSSVLVLVASPFSIVLFAVEGLGGGYLGSGLWIAYSHLNVGQEPDPER